MLKLTVRFGDTVYLTTGAGELVEIFIDRSDGENRVSVGIEAPRSVIIERSKIRSARLSNAVGDDDAPAEAR